jgi:hypothetical protein
MHVVTIANISEMRDLNLNSPGRLRSWIKEKTEAGWTQDRIDATTEPLGVRVIRGTQRCVLTHQAEGGLMIGNSQWKISFSISWEVAIDDVAAVRSALLDMQYADTSRMLDRLEASARQ